MLWVVDNLLLVVDKLWLLESHLLVPTDQASLLGLYVFEVARNWFAEVCLMLSLLVLVLIQQLVAILSLRVPLLSLAALRFLSLRL